MVNMNAADDKETTNNENTNRLNGAKDEATATDSTMCHENNENEVPQVKQTTSSLQSNQCPLTNGAYPKVRSYIAPNALDVSGPSDSKVHCIAQPVCQNPENSHNELSLGKSDNSLFFRNREFRKVNDCSVNVRPTCRTIVDCRYDRNSSSEDEECCIYTYKGDSNQMADLPSSFFHLDLIPSRPSANSRNSSPDMDYLEMDFDPGPSNDRYSSTDSECDDKLESEDRFAIDLQLCLKPQKNGEALPESTKEPDINHSTPISPLSTPSPVVPGRRQIFPRLQPELPGPVPSPAVSPQRQPDAEERREATQPLPCNCGANKISPVSIDENFNDGDAGTMIWKEHEAKDKQVSQISVSACGATAVINALLGLNVQFSVSAVKQHVATRLRSNTAPLPEYLVSRCYAGATHVDMIRGIQEASQNLVFARFFHMYPQRSISLTSWLSHWIRKGAVPILTLNLQRKVRPEVEIPDCWHHQMAYGISQRGVHLTNPIEVYNEANLWPQLASPPVMLIRRNDVISRWTPDTNLLPLADPSRPVWRKMNVLGQVVNMIREHNVGNLSTQHISIPASYSSGVTLCVLRSSTAYDELRLAPELPIDPFATR